MVIGYNQNVDQFYADLPKVELHLHLEGAIPLPALWELVLKYGGEEGLSSLDDVRKRFVYRDFPHFIETWIWKNQYIREYDDFTFFAEAVARDLAVQKVRYAEAFFSAPDFHRQRLELQRIAQAIRAGLDRVPQVEVALIADLVRDFGAQQAAVTLAQVNEARGYGIIGVGIGGSEQDFPPEPFAPVYRKARELGFHTTAHAGEAAGAASIWGALRSLEVERIGHGTRAFERSMPGGNKQGDQQHADAPIRQEEAQPEDEQNRGQQVGDDVNHLEPQQQVVLEKYRYQEGRPDAVYKWPF